MKRFLVGLSMLLLGGYVSSLEHPKETTQDLLDQTVQITCYYKPLFQDESEYTYDYGGICAGVWIGHKHVLTAAHCADTNRVLPNEKDEPVLTQIYEIYLDNLQNIGERNFVAKMQRVSLKRDCDLAILRVISPLSTPHTISQFRMSDLMVGEKVQTVGHPGRFSWIYSSGEVSGLDRNLNEKGSGNLININIGHGSSGGGLFDSNNKLVGITLAVSDSGDERLAFYSTQDCIKSIIDSTKESEAKKNREW